MRLVLNSHSCGSGMRILQAGGHIIQGLACGSGMVLSMALSGCAGKIEPQVQYVRVEVPVQVPCRAPEVAVPPWAAAGLRKTDSLEVKVRALLAERRQRIGYERELKAVNHACR
ncbi:hypothetical protein [Pseudomonas putida]|uniref:hypothetical protein n=1 Tax=Pseudomonas putida TaxID=303 RepID=UPI001E64622E|nr:hypothetical protein [Pseudomonas putida]MCE0962648.1 hypothetical protein [Pseudomonas putida]